MKGFPIDTPVNARTLRAIIMYDSGPPINKLRRMEIWANYQQGDVDRPAGSGRFAVPGELGLLYQAIDEAEATSEGSPRHFAPNVGASPPRVTASANRSISRRWPLSCCKLRERRLLPSMVVTTSRKSSITPTRPPPKTSTLSFGKARSPPAR